MRSFIHSSVPLTYLTTSPKVQRLSKCPLDKEVQNSMVSACRANSDEVCGFVTDAEDILYVPNSHSEPHCNFYMSAYDIDDALKIICKINQQNIIGVFHTHPNNVPWPSPIDINGWPNNDLRWRYWIATNHEVAEWCKTK